MEKRNKAILILTVIIVSVFLFAPILKYQDAGTRTVDYSAAVEQIDLIVRIDSSNTRIQYASSPTAPLIDVNWDYINWHPILGFPSTRVTFDNETIGNTLIVTFSALSLGFSLTNINFENTIITINPTLVTNLSVTMGSGNLVIDTTNCQNKTFSKVSLITGSGNCQSSFISGCIFTGIISIRVDSGENSLTMGAHCEIQGGLEVITSSGNNDVTLGANCTLNENFSIQTGSGSNTFTSTNMSLNNKELTGMIYTFSGNSRATITQRSTLNGNLTLDIHTWSGNSWLSMNYLNNTIGSVITADTGSGAIRDSSLVGFVPGPPGTYTAKAGTLASNIDADIDSGSGDIILSGGFS